MIITAAVGMFIGIMLDTLSIIINHSLGVSRKVRLRYEDALFIFIIKWISLSAFAVISQTDNEGLLGLGFILMSLFSGITLTSTMISVNPVANNINITVIKILERMAISMVILIELTIALLTIVQWRENDYPFWITFLFGGLTYTTVLYLADSNYRTWFNLLYFQLIFDNK